MKFTASLAKIKVANNPRFLDGVTTAPNALTSATASFVAGDVGKQIVASTAKIKAGTTIASVTNGTTVVLLHGSGTAVMTGGPHTALDFRIAGRARTTVDVPLVTIPAATLVRDVITNAPAALSAGANVTKTDAVFNSTTLITSATFVFVAADVGKTVTGAGIPAGTTIASRTSATDVVLSAATTTTGSGKSVTIVDREFLTAATVRVISPGHNYGTAKSALVANVPDVDVTPYLESMTASKALVLRVALTGANVSQLTAGSIDAFIKTETLS